MAKFYFKYGVMGSSKSAQALMTKFNYEQGNSKVILFKSSVDTRDGEDIIKSRIGLSSKCYLINNDNLNPTFDLLEQEEPDVVIVDESQFLSKCSVLALRKWGEENNKIVICYGLKTDFKNELFEGSKALLEVATHIEEIKSMCWCGQKATCNARVVNGEIIHNGEQVQIGGNESYQALCYKHYTKGELHG